MINNYFLRDTMKELEEKKLVSLLLNYLSSKSQQALMRQKDLCRSSFYANPDEISAAIRKDLSSQISSLKGQWKFVKTEDSYEILPTWSFDQMRFFKSSSYVGDSEFSLKYANEMFRWTYDDQFVELISGGKLNP